MGRGGLGKFNWRFEAKRTSRSLASEEAVDREPLAQSCWKKKSEACMENPEFPEEVSYIRLKTSREVQTMSTTNKNLKFRVQ